MSVLVIGADEITPIRAVLHDLGAKKIEHWDARVMKIELTASRFLVIQNV